MPPDPEEQLPQGRRGVEATTRQPEHGRELARPASPSAAPKTKTKIGRGVATWRAAAEAARRPAICEERGGGEGGNTPKGG